MDDQLTMRNSNPASRLTVRRSSRIGNAIKFNEDLSIDFNDRR